MDQNKKPFHETVAEKLIKQLEEGTAPWQRPWNPGESGAFLPYNPATDNRYKGINSLYLLSQDRDDQRWLTYKQAIEAGAHVRKGEKGTGIQYWKFADEHIKKDAAGKPLIDSDGKPFKEFVKLERPRVFFATVFNAEQIDGLPPIQRKPQIWDPIERAEGILTTCGVAIYYNVSDRAFYRPSTDSIHLPEKGLFPSSDSFYATALHEIGHSSGLANRLNRDLTHPFGSEGYAKEELRAEIASMILGDALGIGHDPSQHAAYVGSWIKVLKDDPMEIFRAAADAEKIQNYVLGLEQQHLQKLAAQQDPEHLEAYSQQQSQTESLQATEVTAMTSAETINIEQFTNQVDLSQLSSATADDYRQAAELARIEEQRVKRDPKSTTEDISSAREQRKTADLAATIHDSEFQKKAIEIEQQQARNISGQDDKTYINVPYREKNEAKALGANWDRGQQSWYIPPGIEQELFSKWKQSGDSKSNSQTKMTNTKAVTDEVKESRQYLAVPYNERVLAKAEGARWDKQVKSWYAKSMADLGKLKRWLPENVKHQQAPAMTSREEFAEAMHTVGCVVTGQHPIMDGHKHRIETMGDKAGQRAGFYVGHLDGHPAGHIQNNRTGEVLKWKAKGYSLSEQEKATLQADSAAKLQQREVAQQAQHDRVASAVRELLAVAAPAPADHKYLETKQARPGDLRVVPVDGSALPADSLVMIGKTWKASKALREANPEKMVFKAGDLLLTAQDVNGEIWSVQTIQDNGSKRFAVGGPKQDMFHVVGGQGLEALEKAPAIVIGEGYATADTLSQALGYATVAAFDSGNLPNVATQLREKFPDKPFVIAGDNDMHLELTEGKNLGKEKALAAAKAVAGTALFPIFAPGEQSYPANLEPITPSQARAGNLTDEQQQAIAKLKRYTDFNDLATNSALGREGVERQVTTSVSNIIECQSEQFMVQQRQEQKPFVRLEQQLRQAIKM